MDKQVLSSSAWAGVVWYGGGGAKVRRMTRRGSGPVEIASSCQQCRTSNANCIQHCHYINKGKCLRGQPADAEGRVVGVSRSHGEGKACAGH
jgi:hypothetical protein